MPTPLFQARHYEWLARFMAAEYRSNFDDMIAALTKALDAEAAKTGTNFKPAMFIARCEGK